VPAIFLAVALAACAGLSRGASGYARPELLVETDWLAAHLADPGVRIVDMRPRGYDVAHIPSAVHLDNRATRDPENRPSFVPRQEAFERAMAAIGVSNGTRVVVYDERGGIYAARLWWLLNYYGHRHVALLDGGWAKWTKEGRPATRDAPSPPPAVFRAKATPAWLATARDVQEAIGRAGVKIVDARTAAEIEGRDLRGIRRGGFIPSSIPVYWEDALDPATKAFRPAADLARLYRDRGILPEHDVITYCQVGMRASHDLFVLHLLGYDKLRTYLGSWEEWGNREDLPIATQVPPIALVNARLIDGTGAAPIERGVVIVEDGRIAVVGRADLVRLPKTVQRIDLSGRTIVPGFINGHGHVGETRGLKSGPDFHTEENVRAQLGLYARYGVTTVLSLGGDRNAGFTLRDAQRAGRPDTARLLVAGPVITARTPEEARADVDRVAAMKPDWIKIRVDDNLATSEKMPEPVYRAVIERAHERGLRVAAHLFYLDDAKALLRAGVDYLAHSVRDKPVDDELIDLLKTRGVCVCPTLMREVSTFVYGETPDFFADPFFLRGADRAVLDELRDPARQAAVRESRAAREYRKALDLAAANLKRLVDAGAGVAFGTDSGPPARFQGSFEHLELELMVTKAGLTPAQAIAAATGGAARCLRLAASGLITPGAAADLIILGANPLDEIRNTRAIESVWIAGRPIVPQP
jgi:3-mercaptopyruvate sulfurtransferase SseA